MLLEEGAMRPFSGAVATLGRQHVYVTWEEFQQFARQAGVDVPKEITPKLHLEPKLAEKGYISDETLLAGLGFVERLTLDYSDYEAVDEIFDLNQAETPSHLQNRFDVVLDTGTLEHVFHVPNVLSNLHRMLKPQGRIVHLSPAANCLDHGFYSFSPTFFADYYHANRYEIHQLRVCRYSRDDVNSPVEVFDYLARRTSAFDIGSLDDRVHYTWVSVQRRPASTCGVVPQQSAYVRQWAQAAQRAEPADELSAEPAGTKADRLMKLTSCCPPAQRTARWLITAWRRMLNAYRTRHQFPLPKVCQYR
jgi:SAM-dependent methyltransferase